MNNKKLISAVQNYDKIKNEIMSDASIVTAENGAVIYARVADIDDKYGIGLVIAGDTSPVVFGLAHIIIKISKKSDISIPVIIEKILFIIAKWEAVEEKRCNDEIR